MDRLNDDTLIINDYPELEFGISVLLDSATSPVFYTLQTPILGGAYNGGKLLYGQADNKKSEYFAVYDQNRKLIAQAKTYGDINAWAEEHSETALSAGFMYLKDSIEPRLQQVREKYGWPKQSSLIENGFKKDSLDLQREAQKMLEQGLSPDEIRRKLTAKRTSNTNIYSEIDAER